MPEFKYTIQGRELYDFNKEVIAKLGRLGGKLYCIEPHFPDFNDYEELAHLMHELKDPRAIWADFRFRYNPETKAASCMGVLFEYRGRNSTYLRIGNAKIPDFAKKADSLKYESKYCQSLNEDVVQDKAIMAIALDRGRKYELLEIGLEDSSKVSFAYVPGTFVGLRIREYNDKGYVETTNYVLEDVDSSFLCVGFAASMAAGKDVVFNCGTDPDAKPLLQGAKLGIPKAQGSYTLVQAEAEDKFEIVFSASDDKSLEILNFFESFGKSSKGGFPIDISKLAKKVKCKEAELPEFGVELSRQNGSDFYLLTLKLMKKSRTLPYSSDMRSLIKGACLGLGDKLKVKMKML